MVSVIGWDIGGANTKAVFIRTKNSCVEELKTAIEYFPVWKDPNKLANVLLTLKERLSGTAKLDCMGLTMTAELSDAYENCFGVSASDVPANNTYQRYLPLRIVLRTRFLASRNLAVAAFNVAA